MIYAVTLINEKGKKVTFTGDDYIDIDITARNQIISRLTVRAGEDGHAVYNENDDDISTNGR